MADEMTTKPTIETVLERISAFEERFETRFEQFEKQVATRFEQFEKQVTTRFDKVDARFDSIENEIDRVASVAYSTKAEMLSLRVDFRDLRAQLKEALPIPQPS